MKQPAATRTNRKDAKIKRLEARIAELEAAFSEPPKTRHPELGHKIELAFEVDGEAFYRFQDETNLAMYPRYAGAAKFLEMYGMALNPHTMQDWIAAVIKAAEDRDGTMVMQLANEMGNRLQHLSSIDNIYQIAAQVFFKLDDDLAEVVVPDEANRRIKLFQKKTLLDFIFIKPLDTIAIVQPLLERFSQDASLMIKTMRLEQVIQRQQNQMWLKRAAGKSKS